MSVIYFSHLQADPLNINKYTNNNIEEEERKRMELENAKLKIRDVQEERNREIEYLKIKHQKALIAVMLKMTEYVELNEEGNYGGLLQLNF